MHSDGRNFSEISRLLGVSRAAVRNWVTNADERIERLSRAAEHSPTSCSLIDSLPGLYYSYLLGQYLGDGCISLVGVRRVPRLRISMCDAYPDIRKRCEEAIEIVMPANKLGNTRMIGCTEVWSHSKHWPCLFPQHGPGKKHERDIVLEDWQQDITEAFPREFLTGLIHSDGCRATNKIKKKNGKVYEYPRYFFSNVSEDILGIFANTCDQLGVAWKQNRWNSISIARANDVAYLDQFIGPKT